MLTSAWGTAVSPAWAATDRLPKYIKNANRRPGGPIPVDPIPPSGWRFGLAATSPYSVGPTFGYVFPAMPLGAKVTAGWGVYGTNGWIGQAVTDLRISGALMYYLVPQYMGGPYVEVGAGLARSSGAVYQLGWPVLPHLGFGTTGRYQEMGWDLNFSYVVNRTFCLETAIFF